MKIVLLSQRVLAGAHGLNGSAVFQEAPMLLFDVF